MDAMLVALLVPVVAGSALLGWVWLRDLDSRRTRRVLRRARVTPVAELVDGKLACVVGTVEVGDGELEAMVSRKSCVAYDTTVFFFRGQSAGIPERVEVERRLAPFFVADASGRVRIDAVEAALCNTPIARSERYEERIIEVGAKVRIVGSVVREPVQDNAEHSYRELGSKATLVGSAKYPLLIDLER
ncbi:MAG TPA: hypothetical protein VGG74_22065 [Kofleriaceae bacterium]